MQTFYMFIGKDALYLYEKSKEYSRCIGWEEL